MKISDLKTSEEVLAEDLRDPEFHQEWVRKAPARAVAVQVVAYRAEHGLTQSELARRLGMKQSDIARLETGVHNPTLEKLGRLSRGLGVGFHIDITPESPATVQLVAG